MEGKVFGKKGLIITIFIIVFLLLIVIVNLIRTSQKSVQKNIPQSNVPVSVMPSRIIGMDRKLDLTGNIRPQLEVDVSFKIPGQIIRDIFVEIGDFVEKGDKIAILETDSIDAKMDQAKAAVELAKANMKQAVTNLGVLKKDEARLKNLYKEKAVSRQTLEHMEAQVKTAMETKKLTLAQIRQAEATLKELTIAYNDHTLVAPITGYISKRHVDKGSMSSPGKPVVTISKEDQLKIVTSLTEKEFVYIKKGMPVKISVDAYPEKVFEGSVTIICPTIDPATRTGELEIHIDNQEKLLRSGMYARINLLLGRKEAAVIYRDALLNIPGTGDYFVFVVEDGKAVQKNIKTGIHQGLFIEVISGILPGEQIIISGQNRLRDGMTVTVKNENVVVSGAKSDDQLEVTE